MSRADLFDEAKCRLGVTQDAALAASLGWSASHLCNIKYGVKQLPDQMRRRITELTRLSRAEIDNLIERGYANDIDQSLRTLSDLFRPLRHDPGMLPDTLSGCDPAAAPQAALSNDPGRIGQGRAEPDHAAGDPGTGEKKKARRIELKEGAVYYPSRGSRHSHRRIVGLVQRDRTLVVVYSTGGNHNAMCTRTTFIRWMNTA